MQIFCTLISGTTPQRRRFELLLFSYSLMIVILCVAIKEATHSDFTHGLNKFLKYKTNIQEFWLKNPDYASLLEYDRYLYSKMQTLHERVQCWQSK